MQRASVQISHTRPSRWKARASIAAPPGPSVSGAPAAGAENPDPPAQFPSGGQGDGARVSAPGARDESRQLLRKAFKQGFVHGCVLLYARGVHISPALNAEGIHYAEHVLVERPALLPCPLKRRGQYLALDAPDHHAALSCEQTFHRGVAEARGEHGVEARRRAAAPAR